VVPGLIAGEEKDEGLGGESASLEQRIAQQLATREAEMAERQTTWSYASEDGDRHLRSDWLNLTQWRTYFRGIALGDVAPLTLLDPSIHFGRPPTFHEKNTEQEALFT
jgi:hypothetical protein